MRSNLTAMPSFGNLQDELRRELDPQGMLEEEIFQILARAMDERRRSLSSGRYVHERVFLRALEQLRLLRSSGRFHPRNPPPARSGRVLMFPAAAA